MTILRPCLAYTANAGNSKVMSVRLVYISPGFAGFQFPISSGIASVPQRLPQMLVYKSINQPWSAWGQLLFCILVHWQWQAGSISILSINAPHAYFPQWRYLYQWDCHVNGKMCTNDIIVWYRLCGSSCESYWSSLEDHLLSRTCAITPKTHPSHDNKARLTYISYLKFVAVLAFGWLHIPCMNHE